MNKIEFLTELAILLKDISAEERNEAMQYYNDYFADAGYEKEADIIAELGSPAKVAEEVKANLESSKNDIHEYRETGYTDTRFENKETLTEFDNFTSEHTTDTKTENTYEYTGGYHYNEEYSNSEVPKQKKSKTGKIVLLLVLIIAVPIILIILAITAFIGGVSTNVMKSETGVVQVNATYEDIQNIIVDADALSLEIVPTEYNELVEVCNWNETEAVQFWQEEDTLIVEVESEWELKNEFNEVTIYVPIHSFHNVDIEMNAGTVLIEKSLSVSNLNIDTDAGDVTIDDFNADYVDLNCDAGKVTASGICNDSLKIECDAGEVGFTCKDKKANYNYAVECSVGRVVIGEEIYSGLDKRITQTNNASKNMDIECNAGSVIVNFTE